MAINRRKGRLRIAVPIILLIMILMRLVWMQLRSYPAQADTRALMSLEALVNLPEGATCDTARTLYRAGLNPAASAAGPPTFRQLHAGRPDLVAAHAYLASPAYVALAYVACTYDLLEDRLTLKANQWIFVMTVLCAALMTRMITSSWTIALTTATVLFSRGRLLADIGLLSPDYPIMLSLTAGLMAATHFLRTGATISLLAMGAALLVGTLLERTLISLFLALPVLLILGSLTRGLLTRPVIRRLRQTSRQLRAIHALKGPTAVGLLEGAGDSVAVEPGALFVRLTHSMRGMLGLEFPAQPKTTWRLNYEQGALFRTLGVPFMLWAYWQRRWIWLSLIWVAMATAMALLLFALLWSLGAGSSLHLLAELGRSSPRVSAQLLPWLLALVRPLDLHLMVSVSVLVLCALQAPASGLPSFFEWAWLLLVAALLLLLAAYAADSADFQLVRALVEKGGGEPALLHLLPRRVVLWLEPTILSCGIAGIYNLMKVLDTRVGGQL